MTRAHPLVAVASVAMTAMATVMVTLVLLAGPARAEVPAGNTRSEISAVATAAPAPQVAIVGGDEYVRLTAPPDHEVVVAGYAGEPYLRFRTDGSVEQNDRSPAVVLNDDRYGTGDVSSSDPRAEPQWSRVAGGGTFQWHDHRIHSMVTGPLPASPDGTLFDWTIPITVDGAAGEIRGTLVQDSTGSGWLGALAVVLLVLALLVAGRRRTLATARLTAATAAGAAALAMVGERVAVGGLLVGGVAPLVPVAVALVAAVVAVAARRPTTQLLGAGAVPIVLSGWLLTRATVLWEPVVVSWWATAIQRGLVVVAWAAAIATAVLALEVWRRQLSRPRVSRRAA